MHVHARRVIDPGRSPAAAVAARIAAALEAAVIGQEAAIEDLLLAALAGGHCLCIGPGGVGKSLCAATLARAMGAPFSAIAAAPDARGSATLVQGVAAISDLDRTPPSVRRGWLDQPADVAMVIATLNPASPGEWPLSDAERDRFLLCTPFDYPTAEEERALLRRGGRPGTTGAGAAANAAEIASARTEVAEVPAASNVIEYAARLARSTRPVHDGEAPGFVHDVVASGAGPRGAQALLAAGRAHALLDGHAAVSLDDIDAVALPALRHRLVLNDAARRQGMTADDVIARLVPAARA